MAIQDVLYSIKPKIKWFYGLNYLFK